MRYITQKYTQIKSTMLHLLIMAKSLKRKQHSVHVY